MTLGIPMLEPGCERSCVTRGGLGEAAPPVVPRDELGAALRGAFAA